MKSDTLFSTAPAPELRRTSGDYVRGLIDVLERLPTPVIDEVASKLSQAYKQDRVVYLFGNGGSAALASHAACDLGKGTTKAGRRPFRVVSLTDNVSLITAWANDTSYENVFAAQLHPLIRPKDIAFAISGSGSSPNVLTALRLTREVGAINIGLTGFCGGLMKALCDSCIIVPSDNMQQIEDSHVCVMHAIFAAFCHAIDNVNVKAAARVASATNH